MDKAELIRHEIEKRRDHNLAIGNPLFAAMAEEDIELISFIDSMQEEHTIPDIVDEHFDEMLDKELVSKDLNSFALKYAQDKPYPVTVCQAVKEGARWQKQQMTKEAVDGEIQFGTIKVQKEDIKEAVKSLREGDKVKLIVIKED